MHEEWRSLDERLKHLKSTNKILRRERNRLARAKDRAEKLLEILVMRINEAGVAHILEVEVPPEIING